MDMNPRDRQSTLMMTVFATVAQVAMVVSGHYLAFVRDNVFAMGGMGISLVFGAIWALRAAESKGQGLRGGAIVGGLSALLGIIVSVILGDTEPMILAIGTLSSAVTGAIGGLIGAAAGGRARPAPGA